MSSCFSQQPLYSTKFDAKISFICFMVRLSTSYSEFKSDSEARRFTFWLLVGGAGAGGAGVVFKRDDEFVVVLLLVFEYVFSVFKVEDLGCDVVEFWFDELEKDVLEEAGVSLLWFGILWFESKYFK